MELNLKTKGYQGEYLAQQWYEQRGYQVVEKNFTLRGGELDLIMENEKEVAFIEVKVVDGIEDRNDYLTSKKLQALTRSIEHYCGEKKIQKLIRLDLVFVQ